MILNAISIFGNLVTKVNEGKYNTPKYLDDLQTTFILWSMDNLDRQMDLGKDNTQKKFWSTRSRINWLS